MEATVFNGELDRIARRREFGQHHHELCRDTDLTRPLTVGHRSNCHATAVDVEAPAVEA